MIVLHRITLQEILELSRECSPESDKWNPVGESIFAFIIEKALDEIHH